MLSLISGIETEFVSSDDNLSGTGNKKDSPESLNLPIEKHIVVAE